MDSKKTTENRQLAGHESKNNLVFAWLLLKENNQVKRFASFPSEDYDRKGNQTKERAIKGLIRRIINGKFKGKYKVAIIYDNISGDELYKWDQYGKLISSTH